jgi:hypothetical protein
MRTTRETLRRTALQWAVKSPEGRVAWRHEECVYANFADVFASREEFHRCLARRRAGAYNYANPPGAPMTGSGEDHQVEEDGT